MTAGPPNGTSGWQVSMWATRWRRRLRWQTLRLPVMRTVERHKSRRIQVPGGGAWYLFCPGCPRLVDGHVR